MSSVSISNPHPMRLLPPDPGALWFSFAVGLLAFVAAVALGGILSERRDVALWDSRMLGRLTVQIMPDGLEPPPSEIPAAIAVLKSVPGVLSADLMTKAEKSGSCRTVAGAE